MAEIQVLAARNNWGAVKLAKLQELIDACLIVGIDNANLIDAYVEIEKYNHNIHDEIFRTGSTVNMGKNDIWIAATAHTLDTTLLTTDGDFRHLAPHFLVLELIE